MIWAKWGDDGAFSSMEGVVKLMATGIRERGERERDGERWTNRQRGREIDRQLDRDERLNGGEMTEKAVESRVVRAGRSHSERPRGPLSPLYR